jgi:hypothetical protein
MRGELSRPEYEHEIAFVRGHLESLAKPHWQQFLAAWEPGGRAGTKPEAAASDPPAGDDRDGSGAGEAQRDAAE